MAHAPPELMFEVSRSMQARLAQADGKLDKFRQEIQSIRCLQNGIRREITGVFRNIASIHATLARHQGRFDRFERRFEIEDAALL